MTEKNKIKISRFSFIGNYIVVICMLIFILIADLILEPYTLVIYFLLVIAFLFLMEPELIIVYTTYKLETDYVSEIQGFFVKRQASIPYRNIADEMLKKSVIGRIFNFGDIIVSGSKTEIKMKGVRKPEEIYKEIERKLSSLHGEREK